MSLDPGQHCTLILVQAIYMDGRDGPMYFGKAEFEFPPNYSVLRSPGASNIYRIVRDDPDGRRVPVIEFDAHLTHQENLGPLGEISFRWDLASFAPEGPRRIELNVPYEICPHAPFFEELKRWTVKEPVVLQ